MKKTAVIISLMLALVFAIALPGIVTASAAGDSAVTVSIESVSGRPGETVNVNVSIANNPGLLGAGFTVSYDPGLTLTNAASGEAFSALSAMKPGVFVSPCNFTWDAQELTAEDIKDGVFLTLTFEVSEDAESGDSFEVRISPLGGNNIDSDFNPVQIDAASGTVTVVSYVPGDLSGDGLVNTQDIILLRRYIAGGYDVTINEEAADVNADGNLNTIDVILIRRYIAGGYTDPDGAPLTTNPGGPPLTLKPGLKKCEHTLEAIPAKAATCIEDGNIAYWHCTKCGKYFSDAAGTAIIPLENTVIKGQHTPVIDPAVPATPTQNGLTEGSHCNVCGEVLVAQEIVEYGELEDGEHRIIYDIANGDTYLAGMIAENEIDMNGNPAVFSEDSGVTLKNLSVEGYTFLGWYDGAGDNATQIKKIEPGTTNDVELFAHWQTRPYDITYNLYRTPVQPIADKYKTYTVNKGLTDLPNPTIYNYIFLGWYTDDGTEVSKIPVGTTGDISLNAYWVSKRNLTKKVDKLGDPIIIENLDEDTIYFAYEIGTIENVPLTDPIWTIQSVSGLAQQQSTTFSDTISTEQAKSIAATVSKSTVDSATWTLSEEWNDVTSVNEQWAEQNGMTLEEAESKATSYSGTYMTTHFDGEAHYTNTTDGTSALTYDSTNVTGEKGAQFDVELSSEVGVPKVAQVSGKISAGNYHKDTENNHSGTDTTKVDTTVRDDSSSANDSRTNSTTNTESTNISVSKALSQVISETKGYGRTYSHGGSGSETQGIESSQSEDVSTSSTVTYMESTLKTTTSTYSTDGKSEGCYRLVIAGKLHVFAVVGYHVPSKSYFTYTYSVLDDSTYEFLDYSPDLNFNDYEYGVIPFETPYYVYEYVNDAIAMTEGVGFTTNSANGTATITRYTGDSTDITIPSYISAGNKSYKVTGLRADVFAGKPIRAIALSKFINEIPAGAFKNCTELEEISGCFTKIGDEAFSGCTSLDNFNVSPLTTSIGTDAFNGVSKITVRVLSGTNALDEAENTDPNATESQLITMANEMTQQVIDSAVSSGAQNIVLNIADILDGIELTIEVPNIQSFELQGGSKTFANLKLVSNAESTSIKEVAIDYCTRIPLEISSNNITLEEVLVTSPSFVLLLPGEDTNISLIKDNMMNSGIGKAIVCRNISLSSQSSGAVDGVLNVSGNVYCYGSVSGSSNMDLYDGQIVYITEAEFQDYIKGLYTITFDANGGSCDLQSDTRTCGEPIGSLPTPTRDYYTFEGWFADDTLVTEASTFASDQTLVAHWRQKGVSGWVQRSLMPSGAEIVNTKYSYDLTSYTTSSSSSLPGWEKYNTTWSWSSYGAWSAWSDSAYNSSDSRQVETRSVKDHTNYYYYHYFNGGDRISPVQYNSNWVLHRLTLTVLLPTDGVSNEGGVTIYTYYPTNICSHLNYRWYLERTEDVYKTQYRYRDRSKVYTYYYKKVENKESTAYPTGSNISNIVEWVQYREK